MMFLAIDLFLIIVLVIFLSIIWPPGAPWVPVSKKTALAMLEKLEVKPGEAVYDLGSGDGRILIWAAEKFGAKGVGIEIDPARVLYSRLLIKIKGLSLKIKIIRQNLLDTDFSEADVVTIFLLPKILEKLKPKLLRQLKPGVRIACYRYPLKLPEIGRDEKGKIFLYKIPSQKAG